MSDQHEQFDLAVVGGGSGGFGAALAAARLGLRVVLVEAGECLGGNAVRGGVNCWERVAGGTGIPFDLYRRLKPIPDAVGIYSLGRHGSWPKPDREPYRFPGGELVIDPAKRYRDTLRCYGTEFNHDAESFVRTHWHGVPFEPDAMARVMREMLDETGRCTIRLNTRFTKVRHTADGVTAIELSGGEMIHADAFVDGTADALLCVGAGVEEMVGQESREKFGEPHAPAIANRRINGVTLCYRVNRAATPLIEPLPADVPENCWWRAEFPWMCMNHYPCGDRNLNMLPTMEGEEFLRLGYRAAYEECRRRVQAHWHWLQTSYEEFRGYRLAWIAPALGVRESRRMAGEYVLTEHDLLAGYGAQKHPDIIAIADGGMDSHAESGGGYRNLAEPYGVPYRCLIPKGFPNLLVACRGASFSSIAASSCRLSRTMMQLGQAAGTAAALAHQLGVALPEVPPDRLRQELRNQHVQVDWPTPPSLERHLEQED